MSTRPSEKFPTPPEKISTRHLKKFPTHSEKYHLYRKNLTPPKIILTPLKFLNPPPQKILNPPPSKISQPPSENFLTPPPRKFFNPPPSKISQPPHENFLTPLKISQPHSKNYQPQNMLRGTPPPNIPFFLSISFPSLFKKNLKISGRGLNPLNPPPPLKYALHGYYSRNCVHSIYM